MNEGEVNSVVYPIATGERGETLWQTVRVAEEKDEVWDDWSLSMGETVKETGRGYLVSPGFDASIKGALHLSPFYHSLTNPTDHTTGYGYFMEATGTVAETITHVASNSTSAEAATGITISSFTVAAGTNRVLLAGISVSDPADSGIIGRGTCTFAGYSMTYLTSKGAGSGNNISCGIFYLLNPPVTTGDIVFTGGTGETDNYVMGASYYTGVDQNSPFGNTSSASGASATPSTTTVSASGQMVIDVVSAEYNATFTDDETQARWSTAQGTNLRGASSWEAGAASVVTSWTSGGTPKWAIVAVALKQATTTGGQNFMFIADADKITKYTYDPSAGITDVTTTTVTSGVAGRPAKMNGKWYVPMGASAFAVRLDSADTPTWTATDWYANHLSTWQQGVVANLVRAESTNTHHVSLNAGTGNIAASGWASGTAVGDSSTKITDLAETQGLLFVAKEDGLYDFGLEAESRPIIPFIDRGNIDAENGKGTHAIGDIIFYPSNQGLWRYKIGGGALPVGVNTLRGFRRVFLGPTISWLGDRRHTFVTHAGEWIYVQLNSLSWTMLLKMRLRREGDPSGHEFIVHSILETPLSKGMAVDRNGRLWQKGASTSSSYRDVRVIHLDAGGGTDVEDRRGQASATHKIVFDERNPGRPQDKVQLRRFTVELEGDWDATTSLQLKVWRDSGASWPTWSAEFVGEAITAAGVTTRNWTVGTNDTCYRFRPEPTLTTNSSYTPMLSDPVILRAIVGIRFPEIISIVIPADDGILREFGMTAVDAETNLRRLQNQGVVALRRPGDISTFNAEVESVSDTMYATASGIYAHGLRLEVKRWATA